MSTPLLIALVGAAATVLGAGGAYLAVARRLSGKIETSAAEELWAESRDIRKEYRLQIQQLKERLALLEEKVGELSSSNTALTAENMRLGQRVEDLTQEIQRLTKRNESLEMDNRRLRLRVTELENHARESNA